MSFRSLGHAARALLGVAAFALLLSACGGSSSSGGGATDSGEPSGSGSTGQAPYTVDPQPEQAAVRIAFPARITTVDPLQAGSVTDAAVTQLLGGTLYSFPSSGAPTTSPSLAESGSFGPGDRSFKVTLKPGLTFSDGTPLTAADVVATIERALTFKANAYAGTFAPIETVTAEGKDAVMMKFSRPFPSIETLLAYPNYSILKASEIGKGGEIPVVPVMAGQYEAEGSLTGNSFTLVRNEHYGGVKPAAKTLQFTVVSDPNARMLELGNKQYDFAFELSPAALKSPPSGVLPQYAPTYGFSVLLMNNKQSPLDELGVRKAISLALDKEQVSQIAWSGIEPPLGAFFPPSYKGLSKEAVPADPAAAKKLLAGTSCESGCSLQLTVPTALAWAAPAAVIVQNSLKPIGIEVSINNVDLATLFEKQVALQYELALSYYSDYSTVPEGLPSYCFDYAAGALGCSTGYETAEGSQIVGAAAEAHSTAARDAQYQKLNALYAKDAPFVTMTSYAYTSATGEADSGLITSTPAGFIEIAPLKP